MTSNAPTSTEGVTMNDAPNSSGAGKPGPPSKHQLALHLHKQQTASRSVVRLTLVLQTSLMLSGVHTSNPWGHNESRRMVGIPD